MGLDPFKSSIEVFYNKLGVTHSNSDGPATFWGRMLEDDVANVWQYYDGGHDSYIKNYNAGKIVRRCKRINGVVVNPKFPWFFSSQDRLINKGGINMVTLQPLEEECPLEIKTMHQFALNKWEDGIPPGHIAQIIQYMIVTETYYGEIVIFDNFRELQVFPVELDEEMQEFAEHVIEECRDFWYEKVLPAQQIAKEHEFVSFDQDIPEEIQALEPDPDNSESYKVFLSKTSNVEAFAMQGEQEDLDDARALKVINALRAKLQSMDNHLRSRLIRKLRAVEANQMIFDLTAPADTGRLDFKPRGENPDPTLFNRLDWSPNDSDIREIFENIDFYL